MRKIARHYNNTVRVFNSSMVAQFSIVLAHSGTVARWWPPNAFTTESTRDEELLYVSATTQMTDTAVIHNLQARRGYDMTTGGNRIHIYRHNDHRTQNPPPPAHVIIAWQLYIYWDLGGIKIFVVDFIEKNVYYIFLPSRQNINNVMLLLLLLLP